MERRDKTKPAAGARATSENVEDRLKSARAPKPKCPNNCSTLGPKCPTNHLICGRLIDCGTNL
jgi:hypothetical protein